MCCHSSLVPAPAMKQTPVRGRGQAEAPRPSALRHSWAQAAAPTLVLHARGEEELTHEGNLNPSEKAAKPLVLFCKVCSLCFTAERLVFPGLTDSSCLLFFLLECFLVASVAFKSQEELAE